MTVQSEVKYFRRERLFLKIGGISLEEKESFIYKIYSRTVLLLVFIVNPILYTLDLFSKEFNEAVRDWFYTLLCAMDSTIFINVFFNRKNFERALRTFEMPSFYANEFRGAYEEEIKILQDWLAVSVRHNRTFTALAFTICYGGMLLSLVWRILKRNPNDWILPLGSMTFNIKESPNFEILWFYQAGTFTILLADIISLVMIIVGSLTFLTVQLKILQNYLRRIIDLAQERTVQENSDNPFPSWKYLNQYLNYAIEYHLDIINAAKAIEKVLHGVFLSFFVFTLSFLCINIYRLSLLDTTYMEVLEIILESTDVFFPVLIICFYGEELAYQSEQVGVVAYQMDFVGTDVRFQKGLILLIARSQNTLHFKAGGMISTSLSTAVWIIRSAYSAYMMLRTANTNGVVDQN